MVGALDPVDGMRSFSHRCRPDCFPNPQAITRPPAPKPAPLRRERVFSCPRLSLQHSPRRRRPSLRHIPPPPRKSPALSIPSARPAAHQATPPTPPPASSIGALSQSGAPGTALPDHAGDSSAGQWVLSGLSSWLSGLSVNPPRILPITARMTWLFT